MGRKFPYEKLLPHWQYLMEKALEEATSAFFEGEVPVGAVIADSGGRIIAMAHNRPIGLNDPSAHAEILAIREAASVYKNYRLNNTTIAVTIEPCPMCMGAIINARVERLIFGTFDQKLGACGSVYDFSTDPVFNHRVQVVSGIMEEKCRRVIQDFFRQRRMEKRIEALTNRHAVDDILNKETSPCWSESGEVPKWS